MLKTIFENFGFIGSLMLSSNIPIFILWLAGIAGINPKMAVNFDISHG